MGIEKDYDPNMNWHLVWRTFLKTWRGYKFIFEIESENPFWPGGQNYLEWKIKMTSISALIFQFSFFQAKMHDALYWAIRPFTLLPDLRNQGLFQTLGKFQVLQPLFFLVSPSWKKLG